MPTGSDLAYLDSSALVKLVIAEPESEALRRAALGWPRRVTSRIAIVELIRTVRRVDPRLEPNARRALTGVDLLADSDPVLATASQLDPPAVRALDAIHLATALRVRSALSAFVSYDARQLNAAAELGLPVESPR